MSSPLEADTNDLRNLILGLSDFALVGLAEAWLDLFERSLKELPPDGQALGGTLTVAQVRGVISNPELAGQGLPENQSAALARIILLSAIADPARAGQVQSLLQAANDGDLKAGSTLHVLAVAIALLALHSPANAMGRHPAEPSQAQGTATVLAASLPAPTVDAVPDRNLSEDFWAAVKWLTEVLNADELTALLNAVALGGIASFGLTLIRKPGGAKLKLTNGRVIDVPDERVETLLKVLDSGRS